jgi:hypothetical protein
MKAKKCIALRGADVEGRRSAVAPMNVLLAISLMSAPAAKALVLPTGARESWDQGWKEVDSVAVPVRTMALHPESLSKFSSASTSSTIKAPFSALRACNAWFYTPSSQEYGFDKMRQQSSDSISTFGRLRVMIATWAQRIHHYSGRPVDQKKMVEPTFPRVSVMMLV